MDLEKISNFSKKKFVYGLRKISNFQLSGFVCLYYASKASRGSHINSLTSSHLLAIRCKIITSSYPLVTCRCLNLFKEV